MEQLLFFICNCILIYFAVLWIGYLILLLGTFGTVVHKYNVSKFNNVIPTLEQNPLLPITVIIPAYNEEHRIVSTVTSLLNSEYKNIHIVIINDGSVDRTLQLLIEKYELIQIPPAFRQKIATGKVLAYYRSTLIPHLMVIDKEHSPYANSAADCINAGLNVCRTPLYVTLDADTLVEPLSLSRMIFMYLTNPHCVAIGGDIYVPDTANVIKGHLLETNIPANPLLGVQVCEYLRSFSYGREGWTLVGGALCHPGAFTMLETQAVRSAGGYDASNFSYDAEIIFKLHHEMRKNHYPYSIIYAPSAIAWSEEPATLKKFWHQRSNWQRGLLRCLSRHKQMILNPKYGITGLLAFPYYILFEIFGPVVEAISYVVFILALCFSTVSIVNFAWLLLLAWGYIMFITLSCVILSIITYNKYYRKLDILRIAAWTTADMFFFRQFRAFCALSSTIHYIINRFRGKPQ